MPDDKPKLETSWSLDLLYLVRVRRNAMFFTARFRTEAWPWHAVCCMN